MRQVRGIHRRSLTRGGEVSPTEVEQFREEIKSTAVQRCNGRGGRGTAENFIAALRCLYKHAQNDGLITAAENPAAKTDKPRRQGSTRHALLSDQLSQINHIAATTGEDPQLDTLLLRLHTECPAPGLMETSNTRRIRSHGGTTEVPGRVA